MIPVQAGNERAPRAPGSAMLDMKLEVVPIPVADVDRAKQFYRQLGWRLDADFTTGAALRVVQMTPPGSACSIQFGNGVTDALPGSAQGLFLVVDDVEAARTGLVERGADVSPPFHYADLRGVRVPGLEAARRSYRSWAWFSDPDGNGWLLQEVTTRLPGRGITIDIPSLADLLREAETQYGGFDPAAPGHRRRGYCAAYIVARHHGSGPEDAARQAALHMESAS